MIIISGSGNGLGYQLGELLSGHNIDWIGLNREAFDLSRPDNLEKAIKTALKQCNFKSNKMIYVANAAVLGRVAPISKQTYANINEVFNVNFISHILVIKALLERQNDLHCVFITSGAAKTLNYGIGPYSVSKLCMERYLEFIGLETFGRFTYDIFDPGTMKSNMRDELLKSADFDSAKLEHVIPKQPFDKAKEIFETLLTPRLNIVSTKGEE